MCEVKKSQLASLMYIYVFQTNLAFVYGLFQSWTKLLNVFT